MNDIVKEIRERFEVSGGSQYYLVNNSRSPLIVKQFKGTYSFNWLTDYPFVVDNEGVTTVSYVVELEEKEISLNSLPKGLNTLVHFDVVKHDSSGTAVNDIVTLKFKNGKAVIPDLGKLAKKDELTHYTSLEFKATGKYKNLISNLIISVTALPKYQLEANWLYDEELVETTDIDTVEITVPHNEDTKLELQVFPVYYSGNVNIQVEKFLFGQDNPVEMATLTIEVINGKAVVTNSLRELAIYGFGRVADRLVFKSDAFPLLETLVYDMMPTPLEHNPKFEITSTMYPIEFNETLKANVMYVKRGSQFDIIVRNTNGLYTGNIDVIIPSSEDFTRTVQVVPMVNGFGLVKELDDKTKEYHFTNGTGMVYSSPNNEFIPLMVFYEGTILPDDQEVVPEPVVKFSILPTDNPYVIESEKVTTKYKRGSQINLTVNTETDFNGTVIVQRDDYSFPVEIIDGVGVIDPAHHVAIDKDVVTYYVANELTLPLEITLVDTPIKPDNEEREYPSYLTFVEKPGPSYLVMNG